MKLKKSDINLIFIALGLVIGFCSWQFVYKTYTAKTDELNKANAKLQTEVDYLQDLADHKQQYLDETAAMEEAIEEIKAQFPAQYKEEDDIMYARSLEQDYDVLVSGLAIGLPAAIEVAQPEPTVPVDSDVESDDPTEEAVASDGATAAAVDTTPKSQILLYRVPLVLDMTSSYASVKDILEKVNTDRDRKSVEQISVAFDSETGDLAAKLSYNAYSLTGTDKSYDAPVISGVRFGSSNIFNSADRKRAIDAQKAAAAAEAQ